MNKEKRIIAIISVIISILLIISSIVYFVIQKSQQGEAQAELEEESGESRLLSIKDRMEENQNYYFKFTLNGDNAETVIRKGKMARVITIDQGRTKSYIVKDNTTYLLSDATKKVYEYKNSTSLLNDFVNKVNDILAKKYTVGREEINGKIYRYEEYKDTSALIINYKGTIDESNSKTRVYFEGDNIKYVKTYVGDVEQLLSVEMNFDDQDDSQFEIPSEYSK